MDLDTKFDLILKELKKICAQIDERFEQIDERFEKIDKKFEQVDNKLDSLSLEVGALHRTLFKLDVDTQEKFSTLFESNKTQNDKNLIFEKQLYKLNDTLDNTTFRVSVLENSAIKS